MAIHLVFAHHAEVVNIRNLAQELALFLTILLDLRQAARPLIRRLLFEFGGFLVEPPLLLALLIGRERFTVARQNATERLAIENRGFPALRFLRLDFAVGIEMAIGLLRNPGVVFHAQPVGLVQLDRPPHNLSRVLRENHDSRQDKNEQPHDSWTQARRASYHGLRTNPMYVARGT